MEIEKTIEKTGENIPGWTSCRFRLAATLPRQTPEQQKRTSEMENYFMSLARANEYKKFHRFDWLILTVGGLLTAGVIGLVILGLIYGKGC